MEVRSGKEELNKRWVNKEFSTVDMQGSTPVWTVSKTLLRGGRTLLKVPQDCPSLGKEARILTINHNFSLTEVHYFFLLSCLLFFILFFKIYLFNFIQLQLSAFSPPPSTPPQPVPPPSPTSTLPLDFVLVSFIVAPIDPSPHYLLPTPLWLLLQCS